MEDLKIAVKISYNATEKKYDLVERSTPCKGSNEDANRNPTTACYNLNATMSKTSTSTQEKKKLNEYFFSHQTQAFKVKCEPHDNTSCSSYQSDSKTQNNQSHLKPIDSSFRDHEEQLGNQSNSVSPILTPPSNGKSAQIRIKQEFILSFNDSLGSKNIDASQEVPKDSTEAAGDENFGEKRVRCKSESVEYSNIPIDDRCVARTIKTEPCLVNPGNQSINMKQEPPDDDYDINVDIASPIISLQSDNASIAEELDQENDRSFNKLDSTKKTFEDNLNDVSPTASSSFSKITNSQPRINAYTDCFQSDIIQDDASSIIGPSINVIACSEDPASGCSYVTSSLSSYQVTSLK